MHLESIDWHSFGLLTVRRIEHVIEHLTSEYGLNSINGFALYGMAQEGFITILANTAESSGQPTTTACGDWNCTKFEDTLENRALESVIIEQFQKIDYTSNTEETFTNLLAEFRFHALRALDQTWTTLERSQILVAKNFLYLYADDNDCLIIGLENIRKAI